MQLAQVLAIGGIIVGTVGVLILFRYGMPYRIETKGVVVLQVSVNPDQAKIESRYRVLGWLGIILIVAGAVCQIAATVISAQVS